MIYKKYIPSVIIASILLIMFPLVTNYIMLLEPPEIITILDDDWVGFFASYFGAIFGGVIAGSLTYLGVRLTILNQENRDDLESSSHKKMLLTQLKFTYDMFSNLPPEETKGVNVEFCIYDKEWYKHLHYIDNLTLNEFRTIVNWFYSINYIEIEAKKTKGVLQIAYIKRYLNNNLKDIAPIIDKISSQ